MELRPNVGGVETHVCGFETNVEGVETNFDVVQTHSEHAETFRGSSGHLVLFEQTPLVMRQHRMVARHILMMLKWNLMVLRQIAWRGDGFYGVEANYG